MGEQSQTPCAVYWRARRRQQGIPSKADMPTALPERIYQQGRELHEMTMCPRLDWPSDLFASVQEPKFTPKKVDTSKCGCGCGVAHRNAVSRVVEETLYGVRSRRIVWYLSLNCRNRHMGLHAHDYEPKSVSGAIGMV